MKDSFSSCPVSGGGHRKSEKGRPFEALGRKTPKKSRYYLQLLLSSPLVKVIQEHFLRRQEDRKLMFEVSVGSRLCEGAVKPQTPGCLGSCSCQAPKARTSSHPVCSNLLYLRWLMFLQFRGGGELGSQENVPSQVCPTGI